MSLKNDMFDMKNRELISQLHSFPQKSEEHKEILEKLIKLNENFIHYMVNKYGNNLINFDRQDIEMEATIALMQSAQTFDPDYKVKFSTYCARNIQFKIYGLKDRDSLVSGMISINRKIKVAYAALRDLGIENPTNAEISNYINIDEHMVNLARNASRISSLDAEVDQTDSENSIKLKDVIEDKNVNILEDQIRNDDKEQMHIAIKYLSKLDAELINLKFFEGKTQQEIAATLNLSQSYVSRRLLKAPNKLKYLMEERNLKSITKLEKLKNKVAMIQKLGKNVDFQSIMQVSNITVSDFNDIVNVATYKDRLGKYKKPKCSDTTPVKQKLSEIPKSIQKIMFNYCFLENPIEQIIKENNMSKVQTLSALNYLTNPIIEYTKK